MRAVKADTRSDQLHSHQLDRLDRDLWCSGPRGRILDPYWGLGDSPKPA